MNFDSIFELETIDGSNGFVIDLPIGFDGLGFSVSEAGDARRCQAMSMEMEYLIY